MKPIKLNLLTKVLISIVLGIALSFVMPLWFVKLFVTFKSIFSAFLSLVVPFLIIGFVAPGIAELGEDAGKLLGITVAIAYVSTVLAGVYSYFGCRFSLPILISDTSIFQTIITDSDSIMPYFTIEMEPVMTVTSALVVAFMIGLGARSIQGTTLRNFTVDLGELVKLVIDKVIIPFLPCFIFSIFLEIGKEGTIWAILGVFAKVILLILVLHITFLIFQFVVAGIISKKNPFKLLINMLPSYATALGTQSSVATIPVTLAHAKKNGVKKEVAEFVVPLCATVHLSCSILKIVACAYAISLCVGLPVDFKLYMGFICMLGITMVAAPGVPGGAIMASIGLIATMLNFDAGMQGLMIALYITMDSFGTAGNVTGDGAIAMIIDTITRKKEI
ncbi:MAG: dicarboxylate/amino acid:cation symporter [Bacteroidales bacterium]|nr:dicarboxylate/amino acid:cation symporter [Bacteroidales bacterium]